MPALFILMYMLGGISPLQGLCCRIAQVEER